MPRRAPDPRYARYAQPQTAGAPSLVTHPYGHPWYAWYHSHCRRAPRPFAVTLSHVVSRKVLGVFFIPPHV
ncbi:hypothetical protein C8J57DRAFT_1520783 [Mycena rebaudengoi]|nr:hypothetical protein C8J57DRAFT_1520783 [Mycena rebaudengoi]